MSTFSTCRLPDQGVWRIHAAPTALPLVSDQPGRNRYDDPRAGDIQRYAVRYCATNLRGALLESLAWLRPDREAERLLDEVVVAGDEDALPEHGEALADFLGTRRVARCHGTNNVDVVDIHAPRTLAALDHDLNVEPILDPTRPHHTRQSEQHPAATPRPRRPTEPIIVAMGERFALEPIGGKGL